MAEYLEITAEARDIIGKSEHKLAGSGKLPAVLYGADREATSLSLDRHTFEHILAHEEGMGSKLIHLKLEGHAAPINVIIKEMQRNPVKGEVMHVDFWAVKMTQTISTSVGIHFTGDAPGVKAGGVMNHAMNELHIDALPAHLPEYIEADISMLEIGDTLQVSDLVIPEGVTVTSPLDEVVASVMAPVVAEVEEVVAEEGAEEPEVIGESKDEEE